MCHGEMAQAVGIKRQIMGVEISLMSISVREEYQQGRKWFIIWQPFSKAGSLSLLPAKVISYSQRVDRPEFKIIVKGPGSDGMKIQRQGRNF